MDVRFLHVGKIILHDIDLQFPEFRIAFMNNSMQILSLHVLYDVTCFINLNADCATLTVAQQSTNLSTA